MLTNNVDFSYYPPGKNYIKGIPIITYEGILQNRTLHIAMYKMCKDNTYNQRSLSTLAVENFFGDLTSMEFSGLGCPKSTDIRKLMGHIIQLNKHRLDPTRLAVLPYSLLHAKLRISIWSRFFNVPIITHIIGIIMK